LLIGASLSMTSWIVAQSVQSVESVKGIESVLLRVVPVILNGAAFGLLYLTVPNRRIRVQDAFVGGVAAAAMFELMKRGFGLYVQLFPTYDLIYGTFATVPIFLLWLYLSWCVVLLGAVVVAILPQWRLGQGARSPRSETTFFGALRLIEALDAARQRAAAPTLRELAGALGVLDDRVDVLLEAMEQRGWVRRVEGGGWFLAADLQSLTLADVYRTFAFDPSAQRVAGGILSVEAQRLITRAVGDLEQPLRTLLQTEVMAGSSASTSADSRVESG
jgi:membrane protein